MKKPMTPVHLLVQPEPALGIDSTTGLGKSYQARKSASRHIRKMRARGDSRCVAIFVPNHKLAEDQVNKFKTEQPSLIVQVYRGCTQNNPSNPAEKMCRRIDEIKDYFDFGIGLKAFCENSFEATYCQHHVSYSGSPCGYSEQEEIQADIWILPHNNLFLPAPKNIEPAFIIIDESFWQKSLPKEKKLRLDTFNKKMPAHAELDEKGHFEFLHELYVLIDAMPDGYLDVATIQRGFKGNLLDECEGSLAYLHNNSTKIAVSPTDTVTVLKSKLHVLSTSYDNVVCQFLESFKEAVSSQLNTPNIKKLTMSDQHGDSIILSLYKCNEIHEDWNKPTVLLDATMPIEITKKFYPNLNINTISAPVKNTTITQITDTKLSKATLNDSKLRKTLSIIQTLCDRIPHGVNVEGHDKLIKLLLITNKDTEEKLIGMNLPSSVSTLHYMATSGLDMYKNVPCLLIVGRNEVPILLAEHQASLMRQKVITSIITDVQKWYTEIDKEIRCKGSDFLVQATFHPDDIAEDIRYTVNEAQLIQAIGRARAVRRNSSNPLRIYILTNVPLPLTVDHTTVFLNLVPTKIEAEIIKMNMALLSSSEMLRTEPSKYNTKKVARTASEKFYARYPEIKNNIKNLNLSSLNPIYIIYREKGTQIRLTGTLLLIQYTRNEKGAKPCIAVTCKGHGYKSSEEAITDKVGKLKKYKIIACIGSAEIIKPPVVTVQSKYGYDMATNTWRSISNKNHNYEISCGKTNTNSVYVSTKINYA